MTAAGGEAQPTGRSPRNGPALLFLGLLFVVFFHRVLFRGETFLAFDNLLRFLPWSSLHPDFHPQNLILTDPLNGLVYPAMQLFQETVAHGDLPLWNPWILSGLPQPPPSNPLVWLAYLALPLTTAHDALLALYSLATALFTFLFLRELRLDRLPAVAGAAAWSLNGYVMVWFEYEWTPLLAVTLAATFFCVERWLRTGSRGALLGLVLAAGLALCADFVQILVYEWLLVGAWIVYRIGALWREVPFGELLRRRMLPLGVAFALALPLGANVVTGGLASLDESHREPIPLEELFPRTGQLPIAYLRTLVFPDFYGSPTLRGSFTPRPVRKGYPYNNYNELCVYAGVAPLFLAAFALPWLRRAPVAFFGAAGLASLVLAAGSPAYYPIAALFPGLDLTTPTRILFVFGFCVAVLAAIGLQILLRETQRRRWPGIAACAVLAAAALAVALQVQTREGIAAAVAGSFGKRSLRPVYPLLRNHFDLSSPAMQEPLLLVAAVLLLVLALAWLRGRRAATALAGVLLGVQCADLLTFGLRFNTTSPRSLEFPVTPGIARLQADAGLFRVIAVGNFLHGTLAPFGLQDAGGYASFIPRRYAELLLRADLSGIVSSASEYGLDIAPPGGPREARNSVAIGSPLLDLLGVRYVLAAPDATLAAPGLELVHEGEVRIYENRAAFPRARFVPGYELVPDRVAAYRRLGERGRDDFLARVLLEAPPAAAFRDLGAATHAAPAPEVRIVSYATDRVELELSSPDRGFVVLADGYHPGWRAMVNGQPAEVLRADHAFRAVPVEAGPARIVMQFRPRVLVAGFAASAAAWALGLAATLAAGVRRALRPRLTAPD